MPKKNSREQWRDIRGYQGIYQVSSLGRVRGVDRTIINHRSNGQKSVRHYRSSLIKPRCKSNAIQVALHKNGHRRYKSVSHIEAEAFLPNPKHYSLVTHKDGNYKNNYISNLAWTMHPVRRNLINWRSKPASFIYGDYTYYFPTAVMAAKWIKKNLHFIQDTRTILNDITMAYERRNKHVYGLQLILPKSRKYSIRNRAVILIYKGKQHYCSNEQRAGEWLKAWTGSSRPTSKIRKSISSCCAKNHRSRYFHDVMGYICKYASDDLSDHIHLTHHHQVIVLRNHKERHVFYSERLAAEWIKAKYHLTSRVPSIATNISQCTNDPKRVCYGYHSYSVKKKGKA